MRHYTFDNGVGRVLNLLNVLIFLHYILSEWIALLGRIFPDCVHTVSDA
jgi:hypothetical protein